jgi:hypothetical protein
MQNSQRVHTLWCPCMLQPQQQELQDMQALQRSSTA